MRRKWMVIIFLSVLFIISLAFLLKTGRSYINDSFEVTTVVRGSFQKNYRTVAHVSSDKHILFFNGYVTSLKHDVGDMVEEGEVILEYTDAYNRKQTLKASVTGYVSEITGTTVTLNDMHYYLVSELEPDRYNMVVTGTECLFTSCDKDYLTRVQEKEPFGIAKNGRIYYEIRFELEEGDNLLYGQNGTIVIPLKTVYDVLTVDRKAIYETRDGFYLLPSNWLETSSDPKASLMRIEVRDANEDIAMINGVAIEDMEVCIIDDLLREFLSND